MPANSFRVKEQRLQGRCQWFSHSGCLTKQWPQNLSDTWRCNANTVLKEIQLFKVRYSWMMLHTTHLHRRPASSEDHKYSSDYMGCKNKKLSLSWGEILQPPRGGSDISALECILSMMKAERRSQQLMMM